MQGRRKALAEESEDGKMSKIAEVKRLREIGGIPLKDALELVERHGSADEAIKASGLLRVRAHAPELLEALEKAADALDDAAAALSWEGNEIQADRISLAAIDAQTVIDRAKGGTP